MVVCVLYRGSEKVTILDKKDFTGNIVDNIDNALLFVQRHTKVRLKIEHLQHEEIPDYPEVALRQAVAEHGGTELELKYNDFFTATFQARAQVTGQVGTLAESGAESKQVTDQVTDQVTALEGGWIERTQLDSPQIPTQRYRLTGRGWRLFDHGHQISNVTAVSQLDVIVCHSCDKT